MKFALRLLLYLAVLAFLIYDLPGLEVYDFVLVAILATAGIWVSFTPHTWVRMVAGFLFFGMIIGGALILEPIAAGVIDRDQSETQAFANGVLEMVRQIKPFRPYLLVAATGLFVICIFQPSQKKK